MLADESLAQLPAKYRGIFSHLAERVQGQQRIINQLTETDPFLPLPAVARLDRASGCLDVVFNALHVLCEPDSPEVNRSNFHESANENLRDARFLIGEAYGALPERDRVFDPSAYDRESEAVDDLLDRLKDTGDGSRLPAE